MSLNKSSIIRRDTNNDNTKKAKEDRPKAQLWLNVGYNTVHTDEKTGMKVERFVSLPQGIPVDQIEPLKENSSNAEWAAFRQAQNHLVDILMSAGSELDPGAEVALNLEIRLRRVQDESSVPNVKTNPFIAQLNLG